jgi:hypothetical protein
MMAWAARGHWLMPGVMRGDSLYDASKRKESTDPRDGLAVFDLLLLDDLSEVTMTWRSAGLMCEKDAGREREDGEKRGVPREYMMHITEA